MSAILGAAPDLLLEADAITSLSDGASVATWSDGSGNANHATGGVAPVYKTGISPTGLPVVRFGGTAYLLSPVSVSATSQTVVAVVWDDPAQAAQYRSIIGSNGGNGGLSVRLNASGAATATRSRAVIEKAGNATIANSTTRLAPGWRLIVATLVSGSSWSLRVDGVPNGSGSTGQTLTAGRTAVVGAYTPATLPFRGDMAVLAHWNRILTESEIEAIEAEQAAKWGTPKPKGTFTASSTATLDNWNPAALADENGTTTPYAWSAAGEAPAWVRVEFPEARVVTDYSITARTDAAGSAPESWTFDGSNDGSSWTTLDTRSGETFTAGQERAFTPASTGSYVYYRLNITATGSGGLTNPSFAEWEFAYGAAGDLAAPLLTLTLDTLAPGITVAAPILTLTLDTLAPAITEPPIAAPLLTLTIDTLAPFIPVGAPLLTLVIDTRDPSIPGVVIAAPLLTLTLDTLTPAIPGGGQSLVSGFSFGSELTSGVVSLQRMESGFRFGSRLTQARDWGVPAGSTRPTPYVVITRRDGTPVTGLDEVTIGGLESGVGVMDGWRFSVDRDNPRGKLIDPVTHEAHLYRGNVLMSKGPIGSGRLENGRMVYDVADPRWYLHTGRRIGRIPALNWIYNGDFTLGTAGWTGAFKEGSVPEAKPEFYVVDEPESTSGKGLRIEGVDKVVTTTKNVETAAIFVANESTYLPGGEAALISQADDIPDGSDIHIVGHTADRRAYGDFGDGLELSLDRAQAARASLAAHNPTWTFSLLPGLKSPNHNDGTVAGRGYYEQVASNSTETESAKNRRVALHYASTQAATGHRQYVAQRRYNVVQEVDMLVPLEVIVTGRMRIGEWLGAPADGYAMRVVLVDLETGELIDEETATMSEATPRIRLFEYSATVEVPPNGRAHYISVELYPPAGWSVWSDVGIWPQEQRGYFDMDQALIVRDLTLHVQDTHYGHGDLGIGTRTPLTGVTRTREYPFRERKPYSTAIEELTSLARGVEVDCEVTPTTATIVTHYPRQGSVADLSLTHGGQRSIVKAYRPIPPAGRSLASSVIVQAWGIASTRMEQHARDEAAFGGALLETVIEAEGETPPGELDELAVQHLARSIHPTAAWEVVIDPARTSEVLDKIRKGDRAPLSLPDEGVHGLHRMVARTWDPETDTLTLQLAPEEV